MTPNTKVQQMLCPVCRLKLGNGDGTFSGVFISKNEILTAYHGVADAIKRIGLQSQATEVRHPITVEVFDYASKDKPKTYKAEIVLYDEAQDIALLKASKANCEYPALLIPEEAIELCEIFDEVYTVGASLGHVPIPSRGIITYLNEEYAYGNYWMTNASIAVGNSGGGVFRYNPKTKKHELTGITTHVHADDEGDVIQIMTHMVSFVPPKVLHAFLKLRAETLSTSSINTKVVSPPKVSKKSKKA